MGCGTIRKGEVIETYRNGDYDEDLAREGRNSRKKGKSVVQQDVQKEENEGFFKVEKPNQGDQMLCIKPWLGALKAPEQPPIINDAPPKASLVLEYAYGYRCFDARQNLYYTSDPNCIVYMTAAIGVVLNKSTNTQQIFGGGPVTSDYGHTDDITSLAIHPHKDIIATGEVGKNPKICIWSARDPSRSIKEFRQDRDSRAVSCLGFSYDGQYLASADLHNDHNVRIWEWEKSGEKIAIIKSGPDRVLDLAWSLTELTFCTAGNKHIAFWNYNQGQKMLTKKNGIFSSNPQVSMTSVAWTSTNCLTGGFNGCLYIWAGNTCIRTIRVHPENSTIHSVNVIRDTILTGGRDNVIQVLDLSFKIIRTIQNSSFARALDMSGGNILCGNRDGSIIEISPTNEKRILMQGHSDGEVWGMCIHPLNSNIIVTVGDDNYIKIWDIKKRICTGSCILETIAGQQRVAGQGASTLANTTPRQQARAICININGHVAIGFNDGHVLIWDSIEGKNKVKPLNEPREWIESMAYSPNGQLLAVGSHDNRIYIYTTAEYRLRKTLTGHSSFIIALDWSCDSNYLHTNCGAYELLFWDVNSGQQLKSGATMLKDEVWHTWTAKIGWHVQGIYEGNVDMTHVNTVDRSNDRELIAVGNDWGNVVLFNNPNGVKTKGKSFRGHSEHVTNVKWNATNEFLMSAGGSDQTIMQWRVVK
ncbi:hypothetical protein SteCoe_28741 [Stentor coeruleus]|uniref:Uncharacterized protein n=1 Tax=Stentor coeruleus TaxID=5963 RepID=A0A1R2B7U8_9CILI|nr:hypothetical protein SteCoe_28741 [Stentor coeruleus]